MMLVTGGAGFIGSNFVLSCLEQSDEAIVNVDKLTYAGNLRNLDSLRGDARHIFVLGDIRDRALVKQALERHCPRTIVHFAAESHVDRSIVGPGDFIDTNIVGTWSLLEEARAYWASLPGPQRDAFRFLNVSTDEVYGALAPSGPPFTETTPYAPNSPYAASKAAADHLVRAYHHTFGLPTVTSNCSNNYGPYQFPEKLIPLMIRNALAGEALPIYGDGNQVRDWLYVLDHCEAVRQVLAKGEVGGTYNIGGNNEKKNLDVVHTLCAILDRERPKKSGRYADQIEFVKDRPGHDRRYAIDGTKLRTELGWQPRETFETGLAKTVRWYLDHADWVEQVTSGAYRTWLDTNYAKRGTA
jgi:dTDP-glucose 4,6-dehydratase